MKAASPWQQITSRISLMSLSLGLVYLWFGTLKFFPGLSPAEELASQTIAILTFHVFDDRLSLILLAIWEVSLGVLLVLNICRRYSIPVALVHILLTFSPMLLMPEKVFHASPIMLTLTGQYIVKNLVIISVLLVLWKQHKEREAGKATVAATEMARP